MHSSEQMPRKGREVTSYTEKEFYINQTVEQLMSFPVAPYFAVSFDTSSSHISHAISQCLQCHNEETRENVCEKLCHLWTTKSNSNAVMPLLSVRTGFDLFLRAKNFPPGSEVIMSAVNIPDMARIVVSHNLVIVPLDISIDTLEPKIDLLPSLISKKTVALVVAHIYGSWIDIEPFIRVAKEHDLTVVEDCAECFCGFDKIGHPESDISLFSFGAIKFYTSFGGCIAKVKDPEVLQTMQSIHNHYPQQTAAAYLKKVLKYAMLFSWMQVSPLPHIGREVLTRLGVDYKQLFVSMMRGFPDQMLERIRCQPSTALLASMLRRHQGFSQSEFSLQRIKGEYFVSNLPPGYEVIGHKAKVNNFWLMPVLLDDPDTVVHMLNVLGVEAYRGATQLNLIEPSGGDEGLLLANQQNSTSLNKRYPHEAKHLIDHVIYMPVNKFVPFHDLDKMLKACQVALELSRQPDCKTLRTKSMLLKSKL